MHAETAVYVVQPASAGRQTASEIALDLRHLRRFTMGDAKLEREVLQLFAAHAPQTMAKLRAATTEKLWHDAAHSLKGSAGAVGAACVARAAADAEQLKSEPERWSGAMARLDAAIGATLAVIACLSAAPDGSAATRA